MTLALVISLSLSLKLSVAEVFLLLSLAEAHLFITGEVGPERIHANFLLEMKTCHPSPVPSTENPSKPKASDRPGGQMSSQAGMDHCVCFS